MFLEHIDVVEDCHAKPAEIGSLLLYELGHLGIRVALVGLGGRFVRVSLEYFLETELGHFLLAHEKNGRCAFRGALDMVGCTLQ